MNNTLMSTYKVTATTLKMKALNRYETYSLIHSKRLSYRCRTVSFLLRKSDTNYYGKP
jgi:hypothetical protein